VAGLATNQTAPISGGERRGPARRGRCRGHRCGRRVPPTGAMQGERDAQAAALQPT
jgi:hypothetical protein